MPRYRFFLALALLPGCLIRREPLGTTDSAVDAPTPDARSIEDAFTAGDARVTPDAFVTVDAFVTPDARVTVDAYVAPDTIDCATNRETCNATDDNCDGQVDEGACVVEGETCRPSVFGDRVYLVCPLGRDWDESRALCTGLGSGYAFAVLRGSELASVNMIGDVRSAGFITWVGLSDDGGRIPGASEGSWWWTDNAAESDYAESTNNQDCGVIRGDDGNYGDRDCGNDHWFLCEAPIRPR